MDDDATGGEATPETGLPAVKTSATLRTHTYSKRRGRADSNKPWVPEKRKI